MVQSCIKDDRNGCTDIDECRIFVRVVDTETGADITESGETEEVILALFDSVGRFIATRIFTGQEVKERRPWVISDLDLDGVQVSAWGDLGGVEQAEPSMYQVGSDFVRLPVDEEGLSGSPDDFYFGFRQIGEATRTVREEEVTITQKNARIHVTVRGLTELDAEKYYFVIEAPQNGYDFSGNPNSETGRVRCTGQFNDGGEFVSPLQFLMIHSADPENVGPGEGAVVRLYRTGDDGTGIQIAAADHTEQGLYIGLWSGKTTNVLMDISDETSLVVRIEVTGWHEIYQWSQW